MPVCVLTCVQLFAAPWTVACQAPLSRGFSRQEYWSGLPFSLPGDLPDPRIKPTSLASPALAGGFLTTASPGKPVTAKHEAGRGSWKNAPFPSFPTFHSAVFHWPD